MSFPKLEYLRHILDETNYLIERSRGLSREQFVEDETLKRAFVRSIEIIGEATKKLPENTKQEHQRIAWRKIAGMRDRLIHGYFGIDYDIVWDVILNEIPVLNREIKRIIQEECESEAYGGP